METIIWIAIAIACFAAAWLSGPYHQRLIDSRPWAAPEKSADAPAQSNR